jgi:hypothetical protein
MISVFNRGHFVSAPLGAFGIVISNVVFNEPVQRFKRLAIPAIDIIFQVSKERFDWRIVDAISLSGH